MEIQNDLVNHPQHYTSENIVVNKTYEPIDFCKLFGFELGNAFKYLFRRKHKGTELQDLKKAEFYLLKALGDDYEDTSIILDRVMERLMRDEYFAEFFSLWSEKDFLRKFTLSMAGVREVLAFTRDEIVKLES